MRSVIRMLGAVLEQRVPSDRHVWTFTGLLVSRGVNSFGPKIHVQKKKKPPVGQQSRAYPPHRHCGQREPHEHTDSLTFYFYSYLFFTFMNSKRKKKNATMQRSFLRFAFPERTFKLAGV